MKANNTLQKIEEILEQRKIEDPKNSYVASLYKAGLDKINSKISEEAQETIAASTEPETEHLVHEIADLWFHCMVLLAYKESNVKSVLDELERRFGTSGLVEKAQRKNTN